MSNKQEDENTLLNGQQVSKVEDYNVGRAKFPKTLALLGIIFFFTTAFNIFKSLFIIFSPNLGLFSQDSNKDILSEMQYDFVKTIDISKETDQFKLRNTKKFDPSILYKDRVSLSAPRISQNPLRIYTITKNNEHPSKHCILRMISNNVTKDQLQEGREAIQMTKFGRWILIDQSRATLSQKQWSNFLQSSKQKGFTVQKEEILLDSEYIWIKKYTSWCRSLSLTQYNSILKQPTVLLDEIDHQEKFYVLYSTMVIDSKGNTIKLPQLQKEDLSQMNQAQIQKYLFVFDPIYFNLVTPLNFAYYAKYKLTEILVLPIIAVAQSKLKAIDKALHQINGLLIPTNKFYPLHQQSKQFVFGKKPLKKGRSQAQMFCFVSYPSNPLIASFSQIKQYFSALKLVQLAQKATVVINIPYNFQKQDILYSIFAYLLPYSLDGFNLRLRVRARKSVSSLSIYEASFTYCPSSSIIISSRHNIAFQKTFITTLLQYLSLKNHYYYFDYQNENGEQITQNQPFRYTTNKFRINAMYFDQYLSHVQIFKAELFQMLYFWLLKNDQLDFYQTEASFVLPMMQMVRAIIGTIPKKGYKVLLKRVKTEAQIQQLENLKLYFQWSQIPSNSLKPYKANALYNQAFMRNAREKIPRKLHQVWLGQKKISPFQQRLHKSLKQANHDFQMNLWKNQNITIENFPLTFSLIQRSLKYQNCFPSRSLIAPTVSLIRYQILYNLGGIYIDFKTQGRKNLSPFLKYQLFFIDLDYDDNHYVWPSNVGNGVIGAISQNYHLGLTLSEIISQERFNYKLFDFPKMVGGFILRQSLTDSQLFTSVGFGFHLFSQKPGKKPNLCSSQNEENYDKDQQQFKVENPKTGKVYTVGIPCQKYKQAFLIFYKIIAGSWKVD